MPKRTRKNHEYYAVIRGFLITVPTIFSSWGDVHPLVTGFSDPLFSGFVTLEEAQDYMGCYGVESYEYVIKGGAGTTSPIKRQNTYYAVANGCNPGVTQYYYGKDGAEPEVHRFAGACHKHFRTSAQANGFIEDWVEMYACIVKARIKDELLAGYRPVYTKGRPIPFSLKIGDNQEEDELADAVDSTKPVTP